MPASEPHPRLSRRETQVMEIVYARGRASVSEVIDAMADPPGYSAVRALMGVLVRKGHVAYQRDGLRYVYRPTKPRRLAARSALRRTVKTFFDGSPEQAVAALLDMAAPEMSLEKLDQLSEMIEKAKLKERRAPG